MEVISISSDLRRFAYLSWPEASKAALKEGSTIVWPFGACEQHGPQLPLITDSYFAESVLFEMSGGYWTKKYCICNAWRILKLLYL